MTRNKTNASVGRMVVVVLLGLGLLTAVVGATGCDEALGDYGFGDYGYSDYGYGGYGFPIDEDVFDNAMDDWGEYNRM